ncbi:CPBP family intramembrane glutamic endopeptidase [Sutcliffiella horikoshii]|uniref:CPBP family intramembrane metalloprotease n=1 Tax=Sutcliffiella horikoshii TaxID=79883 RepID=A0A5D4TC72_9BACI|nr:CPBP family intramembrane glutamic endopeptidase [Sutcliffiella horikoshii]TYS71756.1 CPBP family intramembrane metalloprotease [Sutcliffiella horikoshii]
MLGIIVQISLSWIILRIVVKKDLTALGIKPIGTRSLQFLIGFMFTALLCASIQMIDAILTNTNWELSSKLTLIKGLNAFWLNVKGVVFEELIFRGALLFIIIHKFGAKIGILISGVSFGIYHWFSYGVLGDIGSMTVVFFITAMSGLVWAYAFSKTKSIALPIGLHLGWNFTFNSIFSKGPWGEQILVPDKVEFISNSILNIVVYFVLPYVVVPIVTWLLIRFYGRKYSESNKLFIT